MKFATLAAAGMLLCWESVCKTPDVKELFERNLEESLSQRATFREIARNRQGCQFGLQSGTLFTCSCNLRINSLQFFIGLFVSSIKRLPLKSTVVWPISHSCFNVQDLQFSWCKMHGFRLPSYHESPCALISQTIPYPFTVMEFAQHTQTPWTSKLSKLFWRGTCPLSGIEAKDIFTHPRTKLIMLADKHADLIDARLMYKIGCKSIKGHHLISSDKYFTPEGEVSKFKFTVDIEGDGCSGRFSKLLSLGTVVLKYFDAGFPFFHGLLKPYVHYVPVQKNMENLIEQVSWLRRHDDQAQQIAKNAKLLAEEIFKKDFVLNYTNLFLQELVSHRIGDEESFIRDKCTIVQNTTMHTGLRGHTYFKEFRDTKGRVAKIACQ